MPYNTGNPIPSSDAKDLSDNAENLDNSVNTALDTWTDRLGVERRTIQGQLKLLGYTTPDVYAGGLVFTIAENMATIDRNGTIYAPLPSAIPFTTSGTWTADDEDKFFVVQGVTTSSDEIVLAVNTVADMKTKDLQSGQFIRTKVNNTTSSAGGATYLIQTAAEFGGTPDGFGDHVLDNGNVAVLQIENNELNIMQFGAEADGITDDTAAIDAANERLSVLTPENALTIDFGSGRYIYNGVGFTLNTFCKLKGSTAYIDATSNVNTGYLFDQKDAWGSRIEGFYMIGNTSNPNLRAVRAEYTRENGGVFDCIIEDFHFGMDIDKMWYAAYARVLFRSAFPLVTALTGSHLTIAGNLPTDEVNNIELSAFYFSGSQNNSVVISGNNQNIAFRSCSFETDETRVVITSGTTNTLVFDTCYVEGDLNTAGSPFFIDNQSGNVVDVRLVEPLIRSVFVGDIFKNVNVTIDGGFINTPSMNYLSGDGEIIISEQTTAATLDLYNPKSAGAYDSTNNLMNNGLLSLPKQRSIADMNSIIPKYVHFKDMPDTTHQPIFKIYLPDAPGGTGRRLARLTIDVHIRSADWFIFGTEQYVVSMAKGGGETAGANDGVRAFRVYEDDAGADLIAADSLIATQIGYDATTDAQVYQISYRVNNATRLGECYFELSGSFFIDDLNDRSFAWRVEKL